jgi:hypothetical protein
MPLQTEIRMTYNFASSSNQEDAEIFVLRSQA